MLNIQLRIGWPKLKTEINQFRYPTRSEDRPCLGKIVLVCKLDKRFKQQKMFSNSFHFIIFYICYFYFKTSLFFAKVSLPSPCLRKRIHFLTKGHNFDPLILNSPQNDGQKFSFKKLTHVFVWAEVKFRWKSDWFICNREL